MLNKAMLIGNLGKDPEVRFTGDGKAVCKFSVATSESWIDAGGQKQERTTWHNVVVWGKAGEACGKHLEKGSRVYLEGRIDNRSYEKDGVTKYITEIVAERVRFLSFKKDAEQKSGEQGAGDGGDGW
jgi:single-strand DNA-binding protein